MQSPSKVSINSPSTKPLPLQSQSIQEYYQQIVINSSQNSLSKKVGLQILRQYKQMHKLISSKIQKYHNLNENYKKKIQNDFLVTFSKIIQKIGEDLLKAEQAYFNIDKEIMKSNKCIKLNQNLHFFMEQTKYYKKIYEESDKYNRQLKSKINLLLKQNKAYEQSLFKKTKECFFLKNKLKKYENQINVINNNNKSKQITSHNKKNNSSQYNIIQKYEWKQKNHNSLPKNQITSQNLSNHLNFPQPKSSLFKDIQQKIKNRQKQDITSSIIRGTNNTINVKPQTSRMIKNIRRRSNKQKYNHENNFQQLTPRFSEYWQNKKQGKNQFKIKGKQLLNQNNNMIIKEKKSMMNSTIASNFHEKKIEQSKQIIMCSSLSDF